MITDRIDNITLIPDSHRRAYLPPPKSVKIELSPRCNYKCGFCALRTREKQPKKDMDFEFFQKITTQMRDAGVEEIGCFFLGESFMNPALLVKAIDWCKQKLQFPYVFLTSNASLATPLRVEQCMQAGLDSLKWSVNAYNLEQFKKIMGVKGRYYDASFENIKSAWEVREHGGYQTKLYASSIRYDDEQMGLMEDLLDTKVRPFVDQTYFLPLYSMGSFATQREEELGYRPTAGNQGRWGALREPLPCWSVATEGHVRADGGLSACCFDAGGQWKMADLNKEEFMDGWNSQKFQDLRIAHMNKDVTGTICEDCVAYV